MRIVWSSRANREFAEQLNYLAKRNPYAAHKIDETIERSVAQLARHPDLGRPGAVAGSRELVVKATPFIVVYRIRVDDIVIVRLIHGARQRED